MFKSRRRRSALRTSTLALAMVGLAPAVAVHAQTATYNFNIPPQNLGAALRAFARASGQQLVYDNATAKTKTSGPLVGTFNADDGLRTLLAGSGMSFRRGPQGVFMISGSSSSPQLAGAQAEPPSATAVNEVVVTGTRIKGAPQASPTIALTQRDILQAGQTSVSAAMLSIPQDFPGGQNPGVALGATGGSLNNQNTTGASSVNLRGLGPDATLTLLDGHRLVYDSFSQAVDLSAIPLAAVKQIQVVADGASAIYGSDAVAGVVNVILRHDYNGVTASARIGGATDGGDFQQQYDFVVGKKWSSGGFILTYNNERDGAISASQRPYTNYLPSPYDLLPSQYTNGIVLSAHQEIASIATFEIDALFNQRTSSSQLQTTYLTSNVARSTNYNIAPSLTFNLPNTWTAEIEGLYGVDNAKLGTSLYAPGRILIEADASCYCNTMMGAEVNGEGPLFTLPAGDARAAVGGGYRRTDFANPDYTFDENTTAHRQDAYAFGELFIPLIGASQNILFVNSLSVTAAARYEHYSDFGDIITPKIGLIYSPTPDIDLKGSWGQSFKAPTLLEEYSATYAYLYPASMLGGNYPTTATAIYTVGGNRDLKPERATTWTATADWHPGSIRGLSVELSYFHTSYTNRVVVPIASAYAAFSDPAYAPFLSFNPSQAEQSAVLAQATGGVFNETTGSYNPANVVAIVDNTYTNVASQQIDGVDLAATYGMTVGSGQLTLSQKAAWLNSTQQNSPLSPSYELAGTLFNPPHLRSRTGVVWEMGDLTVSGFANYIGGVTDTRSVPNPQGSPMVTGDLAAQADLPVHSLAIKKVNIALSVQNISDARPPYLKNARTYYVDYDSTNYSAIGRFISFTLTVGW
ncbi:MAG: TonB-dependent receptor [Caulobacteraceae bacterium]|nr:TonB-dependent receptor [Caulobacteraceae bacterium]